MHVINVHIEKREAVISIEIKVQTFHRYFMLSIYYETMRKKKCYFEFFIHFVAKNRPVPFVPRITFAGVHCRPWHPCHHSNRELFKLPSLLIIIPPTGNRLHRNAHYHERYCHRNYGATVRESRNIINAASTDRIESLRKWFLSIRPVPFRGCHSGDATSVERAAVS